MRKFEMKIRGRSLARALVPSLVGAALAAAAALPATAAWEPNKPVEFVVPAGTGGGADQMARLIQGIIVKHKLMKESVVVVNKSGGAGAEGSSPSRKRRATRTRSSSRCRICSRRRWPRACPSTGRT